MSDFVEAYRERKRQEKVLEFADISHCTIEILENFPTSPRGLSERFHEVMVDEYQDTNHIQERMLELLSMATIVLWWEISSNLSTASVRQTADFSENSNAMQKILSKKADFAQGKFS